MRNLRTKCVERYWIFIVFVPSSSAEFTLLRLSEARPSGVLFDSWRRIYWRW